ncbi:hypothetical protein TNCV_2113271 [Trichonephila clavipes]|nr:hypothetical protein TNCV_2113271 [Trichonephila clavipes]
MIWINPDQRKLQRILWRENMDEPIKTFELSTVTYGTECTIFSDTECTICRINEVVNDININRCIVVEQPEVIELHLRVQVSSVVYCKSITSDGKMLQHLIASKSRVAPTKQTTTIPGHVVLLLVHRVKQV